MSRIVRVLRAAALALSVCVAATPALAQDDDDRPALDVPAWARQAYQLVEDEEWDDALRALAALARTRNNEFFFHYLTAEAAVGKMGEVTEPAAQLRLLRSAHAALVRAAPLAPPNARAEVAENLKLVGRVLADRGATADGPTAPAEMPNQPAAAAAWRTGQRVEAYVDGAWNGATVLGTGEGAEAGQVRVSVDGYTYGVSRIEWVDARNVRRPAAAPAPAAPPPRGLPAALPSGLYICTTSYPSLMTLGRLRLGADGTYTGMSTDGTGRGGQYRYDAATGRVDWVGGLQGFFGQVSGTRVFLSTKGAPYVRVSYQARAGGNTSSMDCSREGA